MYPVLLLLTTTSVLLYSSLLLHLNCLLLKPLLPCPVLQLHYALPQFALSLLVFNSLLLHRNLLLPLHYALLRLTLALLFLLETSLHLPHQLHSLYLVQLSYSTLHLPHSQPPKHSLEIIIVLSHHHSLPEDSGQIHPRKFLYPSGTDPHCCLTLNCVLNLLYKVHF